MRRTFADELQKQMVKDERIFLLVGDLGYGMFDSIFAAFPDRAINVGAAEQAMLDIAVGLAYDGKIPFCYSITPFLIYRPFETLRTYIDHEKLPVKLVGSGRNADYAHDGMSHDATDVSLFLDKLPNLVSLYPKDKSEIPHLVAEMVSNELPTFISLRR